MVAAQPHKVSTGELYYAAATVILGNWVGADSARTSADADARLGGSSMLIAEPVRLIMGGHAGGRDRVDRGHTGRC
jgi:hypothetical protein